MPLGENGFLPEFLLRFHRRLRQHEKLRAAEKASIRRTGKFHSRERHSFLVLRNRQAARSVLAVNDFAADNRGFHLHVPNGFRLQFKDVVTQDNNVREFAR